MKHAPDEVEMRRMPADNGPLFESIREPILAPKPPANTRREAHEKAQGAAALNRARILAAYKAHGPMTADAAGEKCGLIPLAARPRVTELVKMGQLIDSGHRGPSSLGNSSVVWKAIA